MFFVIIDILVRHRHLLCKVSIDKKHNIFCFQLLNLFVQADVELSKSHVRLKVRGDKNNKLFDRLYINVTSFIKVAHKPTNTEA